MRTRNFRDILALLIGAIIFPLMWILNGMGIITVSEGIKDATIVMETLIIQFYFRKAMDVEKTV